MLLWASPTPPVSAGSAVLILVQLGSLGLRQEIEAIVGPGVMDISVKEGHGYSSLEMLVSGGTAAACTGGARRAAWGQPESSGMAGEYE